MMTVTPVHDRMWRILRDEELAGYVDAIDAADGIRYRARRLNVQLRRWVSLGEYWELEHAIYALSN